MLRYTYDPPYNQWYGVKNKNLLRFKVTYGGTIATKNDLPPRGFMPGVMFNVQEDGSNYMWNGLTWDKMDSNPFVGATSSKDGIQGLVPQPKVANREGFLYGGGGWKNLDASDVKTGVFALARIPAAAMERLVQVADQTERYALTTASVQNGDTVLQQDTHTMYRVVDQTKLDEASGYVAYQAATAQSVAWGNITGTPLTFTPSAHTHENSDINYKRTSLSNALIGNTTNDDVVSTSLLEQFVKAKINVVGCLFTNCGDILYRHPNNKGSVLVFDMYGTKVKLFIADAQYRTVLPFASENFDSSLVNFNQKENSYLHADSDSYTRWYLVNDAGDINSSCGLDNDSWLRNPPILNDTTLQYIWSTGNPSLATDLSARENCNIWMTYNQCNTSDYAVGYTRNLNIEDIGDMDIPNQYELIKIFLNCNFIDMLDPTIDSYSIYALGNIKNPRGRFCLNESDVVSSCTENSSSSIRSITRYGTCDNNSKTGTKGIIPIRELNLKY